jgi:hypothetical protein
MSGTARSVSQLYAETPSGGVANVTAAVIRDGWTSFPPFDDPANASGLGAPAILRGTVQAHLCAGVTQGSGQTLGVRQATYTGLQNAINYAGANGKFFEIEPGIYEYYSATALTIPYTATGFTWRGTTSSRIIQFYTTTPGVPVFVVGDSTNTNEGYHINIDGASFEYGVSQTGFTSSCNLVFGGLDNCYFRNVNAGGPSGAFPAYNCITWSNGGGGAPCFSSEFDNFSLAGAQNTYFNCQNVGTGNLFDNFYINGNSASITGYYFFMAASGFTEQNFRQMNIEHGSCNQAMFIQGAFGLRMENLHVEDITLTGANPCFILSSVSGPYCIDNLTFVDNKVLTASMSGTAAVINDYAPGGGSIRVNDFIWIWNMASQINAPLKLLTVNGLPSNSPNVVTFEKARLYDPGGNNLNSGNISFDTHMPVGANAFIMPTKWGRYDYGKGGSEVNRAVINVSTTYTHYGQFSYATIIVPDSITSFIITLAATMGATGTLPPQTGNIVNIYRSSGTVTGTLTVKDDAGTTLTTNTTSTDLWYQFNGTHYVTFTPVT